MKGNKARERFVTGDETAAMLAVAPNEEWKLLIALSRFGGLRFPSEALQLRWSDVDWAGKKLTVLSPKLARYEDKATRVVPIFPELMPHLQAAWDLADEGQEHVITLYRSGRFKNLGTQLKRIMAKAGVKPWQNMRSLRATELAADYPGHVAAAWRGSVTA